MRQFRKMVKQISVFEPDGKGGYDVFPEGRQLKYSGAKDSIVKTMVKKYPTLKVPMMLLIRNDTSFFYDPFKRAFRAFVSGTSKENRNESITKYLDAVFSNFKVGADTVDAPFQSEYITEVVYNGTVLD